MYKCSNCGYIHWVEELPEICPSCRQGSDCFVKMGLKEVERIQEAMFENDVLVDTLSALNNVIENMGELMEEADDLSPVFPALYKNSVEMAQTIKAEIENRIKNGLWG